MNEYEIIKKTVLESRAEQYKKTAKRDLIACAVFAALCATVTILNFNGVLDGLTSGGRKFMSAFAGSSAGAATMSGIYAIDNYMDSKSTKKQIMKLEKE